MTTLSSSLGPKFFGTSEKKSWFDEGDRCSPGPGAHELPRAYASNPPQWSVGKSTERDSFLDKNQRASPSPDRYNLPNVDKTHLAGPRYSVPIYAKQQNPTKIDEGSIVDYYPEQNLLKRKIPQPSFGYTFERDYSTIVPPPNRYDPKLVSGRSYNRTERSFSIGERPPPYGQQAKYPYVGKYNVGGDMGGSMYTIGDGNRPEYTVGASPGQFYQISGDMVKLTTGKTLGMMIPLPRNKDELIIPSPDKYNVKLPNTTRNIITYNGIRSQIGSPVLAKNPSPDKYQTELKPHEQTISFTREKKQFSQLNDSPGVGSYSIQMKLSTQLGQMSKKLKKLTQFVGPAPSAYEPKQSLTKFMPQRSINLYSNRTDFSKSITGSIGPGVYNTVTKEVLSLGKMGKGPQYEPNRNANPGPGSYELPNHIGKLPKYCNGPKKLSETGFSQIELDRLDRIRKRQQKVRQKKEADERLQEQIQLANDSGATNR